MLCLATPQPMGAFSESGSEVDPGTGPDRFARHVNDIFGDFRNMDIEVRDGWLYRLSANRVTVAAQDGRA
jgi:hypothetical protein